MSNLNHQGYTLALRSSQSVNQVNSANVGLF